MGSCKTNGVRSCIIINYPTERDTRLTPKICGYRCLIKNGRLYVPPNVHKNTIDIYKVKNSIDIK